MSRRFMKVYRGLFFRVGTEPEDPETGDVYFDGSTLKICTDGAAFDAIGSGSSNTFIEDFHVVETSASDEYAANVTLALNFEDTTFVDHSSYNQTIATGGTPILSTEQVEEGIQSLKLSSGSYISTSHSVATMGSNDFTVEGWFYFNDLSTLQFLWSKGGSLDQNGLLVLMESGGALTFVGAVDLGWSTVINSSYVPTLSTWTHIAVVRSGATVTLYAGGVSVGSASAGTDTLGDGGTTDFRIGAYYPYEGGHSFNGYVDFFRVTVGVARYTTTFTPPTAYSIKVLTFDVGHPLTINTPLAVSLKGVGLEEGVGFSRNVTETTITVLAPCDTGDWVQVKGY